MQHWKRLLVVPSIAAALVAAMLVAPQPAAAAVTCNSPWAGTGTVAAVDNGGTRSLDIVTSLSQQAHDNAVQCGGYMRVTAEVTNAGATGNSFNFSANIPAYRYLGAGSTPWKIGGKFRVGSVGTTYRLHLDWQGTTPNATFTLWFMVLRWANPANVMENSQCHPTPTDPWAGCLYPPTYLITPVKVVNTTGFNTVTSF